MKNILIGIGVVVVIGGATYALVSRNVLKEFFQTGDKPTQQQFSNTIDSNVNLQDNTEVKSAPIYQAKVVTQDQKEFKLDAVQSVTFRWTPLSPVPKESVMYRLKVWQLMQGQNGSQAMKSNNPIVTKDVTDISEATVSGIYTGPCKPPYLCDFVWSVEAISSASTNTGAGGAVTPATTEEMGSSTQTR